MIIAASLVGGPMASVDIRLGDVPFYFDDVNSDVTLYKVWVESPYSRPTRRLLSASTPFGALPPANHHTFIVGSEGVRDIPSSGRKYGTNGISRAIISALGTV